MYNWNITALCAYIASTTFWKWKFVCKKIQSSHFVKETGEDMKYAISHCNQTSCIELTAASRYHQPVTILFIY